MNLSSTLAKHLRAVFFGGNWTGSNLKDQLADVTFLNATNKLQDCNTILSLTFHISYYITGVIEVFSRKPLSIKDKFSFDHPEINNEAEWQDMLNTIWIEAEALAQHIEHLSNDKLWEDFTDPKYGNYYRNIAGIIEHTHYHLGQIVLLKKQIKLEF